jgi:hypothetical protein
MSDTPTTTSPCTNCGHVEPHNAPAGDIADGCSHPMCNCGFDSRGNTPLLPEERLRRACQCYLTMPDVCMYCEAANALASLRAEIELGQREYDVQELGSSGPSSTPTTAPLPDEAPVLAVSEIREGEENDGELQSTDIFLSAKAQGITLLVNVPAGSFASYSAHLNGKHQSGRVQGAIKMTPRDQEQFLKALADPPEPNEVLRKSFSAPPTPTTARGPEEVLRA